MAHSADSAPRRPSRDCDNLSGFSSSDGGPVLKVSSSEQRQPLLASEDPDHRRRGGRREGRGAGCFDHHETLCTTLVFGLLVLVLVGLLAGAFFGGKVQHKQYAVPLLLLSIVPSFFIIGFMYLCGSSYRSAPAPFVAAMYLFGIVGAVPIALMESFVGALLMPNVQPSQDPNSPMPSVAPPNAPLWHGLLNATLLAFVIAALTEESKRDVFCLA